MITKPFESSKVRKTVGEVKTVLSFLQWLIFFYGAYTLWTKGQMIVEALDLVAKK